MDLVMIVLRLAHIGAGAFWVGAAFTMFLFVQPTLEALGGQTQKSFMEHINKQRKLVPVIVTSTIITVGAGAAMYWISSDGLDPAWVTSPFGIGITIGALAATTAFVLGIVAITPTFKKMEKLGEEIEHGGGPPTPEQMSRMEHLGAELKRHAKIDLTLLAIAVSFMAIARYL